MSDALAIEMRDVFRIHEGEAGGAVALQGLTLAVRAGERCVVLGPSGSGKSTLLRIASGFERPSAGIVRVLGADLGRLALRRASAFRARHLGFLDQHYARALSPALTCVENVELTLRLAGSPRPERRHRALELLARVGLDERANDPPDRLSGGEQQRVAICAALSHRPAILFADEPAGELDAVTAATVYELLAELAASERTTLVVVSHDEQAVHLADRVVHVRDGRVTAVSSRSGEARLVIGRGGWVHLPAEARRRAGIDRHASWRVDQREIRLAGDGDGDREAAPRTDEPAAALSGEPVVELRGVRKGYGEGKRRREVLTGLDASLASGTVVAIQGRSGSGKTTILHLLAGLERPDAGSVVVAGRDLTAMDREELAAHRRVHIGWVGQEPGLVPFATALENTMLALRVRDDAPRAEHRHVAGEWLERLGLSDCAERIADRLSAGERQRVAIARTLARRPDVLLLDEPTARLDEENASRVADLLRASARSSGALVVCATHDRAVAERADVVISTELVRAGAGLRDSRTDRGRRGLPG
jgi:ABC-type lipoprotein export system ATPase subunit